MAGYCYSFMKQITAAGLPVGYWNNALEKDELKPRTDSRVFRALIKMPLAALLEAAEFS